MRALATALREAKALKTQVKEGVDPEGPQPEGQPTAEVAIQIDPNLSQRDQLWSCFRANRQLTVDQFEALTGFPRQTIIKDLNRNPKSFRPLTPNKRNGVWTPADVVCATQ